MLGKPVTQFTLVSNTATAYTVKANVLELNAVKIFNLVLTINSIATTVTNELTAEELGDSTANGFVVVGEEVYVVLQKAQFPYEVGTYLTIGFIRNTMPIVTFADFIDVPEMGMELFAAYCLSQLYVGATVPRYIQEIIDNDKGII